MHQHDGKPWDAWNRQLRTMLPKHQVKTGPDDSMFSFSPADSPAKNVRTTAYCLLSLAVYYRHPVIFERSEKPPLPEYAVLKFLVPK